MQAIECHITGYARIAPGKDELIRLYSDRFSWEGGRRINQDAQLVHLAVSHALDMAAVDLKKEDRSRIGIVLGTAFGGLDSYEEFYRSMKAENRQPNAFSNSLPGIPAAAVSIYYGITGPAITFMDRSGAGADSLVEAAEFVHANHCDMVIAGTWHWPSKSSDSFAPATCGKCSILILESSDRKMSRKRLGKLIVRRTSGYPYKGSRDNGIRKELHSFPSLQLVIEMIEAMKERPEAGVVTMQTKSEIIEAICSPHERQKLKIRSRG